jgi:hypothetical protein
MVWFIFSFLSAVEAGMTVVVQYDPTPITSNNTNATELNYTTLSSSSEFGLNVSAKNPSDLPGNSTDTSTTEEAGLSLWSWLIIGGGFLALLAVIIGLYVDERNRLDGYEKMITSGTPPIPASGGRVISVALVHSCPSTISVPASA